MILSCTTTEQLHYEEDPNCEAENKHDRRDITADHITPGIRARLHTVINGSDNSGRIYLCLSWKRKQQRSDKRSNSSYPFQKIIFHNFFN